MTARISFSSIKNPVRTLVIAARAPQAANIVLMTSDRLHASGEVVVTLRGARIGMAQDSRCSPDVLRVVQCKGRWHAIAERVWIASEAELARCYLADTDVHRESSHVGAEIRDPEPVAGTATEQ